ncbi:unnamed protein product [Heligmosomoides polygyrus]|uniref:CUE domain-containing protein n=1 Tax=Heligmosomoides polygyrus TaxID=6339 RepID=A0A183GLB2_HELPZ|nr:unnamed protein product [Heligmosomoides polygyrus]
MSQRTKSGKKATEASAKVCVTSQEQVNSSVSCSAPEDFSELSVSELINAVLMRNKDPIIEQMMYALISKLPQEMSERIELENKERSIVIEWIPEATADLPPSEKQWDLEAKLSEVFDVLDRECRPLEVYRMGRHQRDHARKVTVVLPSKSHWATALKNSWKLRDSATFNKVRVQRSMTSD